MNVSIAVIKTGDDIPYLAKMTAGRQPWQPAQFSGRSVVAAMEEAALAAVSEVELRAAAEPAEDGEALSL